jgi:hypothetical protein
MAMKTSIWYHTADKQPTESGYYIAYKGTQMGDDSCNAGYYYYNKSANEWRDSKISSAFWANVYYWTEADPQAWVDSDPPLARRKESKSNPALEIALNNVYEAVRQYEIVKALT